MIEILSKELRLPLLVALLASASLGRAETTFSEPQDEEYQTDDGTVALAWEDTAADAAQFEVRRWNPGEAGEGVLVYEGPDTASFVSGLPEGTHELRIRSRSESSTYPEWGDSELSVTVEYIDMKLVWWLMGAGLVAFACLVATIVVGHRTVSKGPLAEQ